MGKRPRNPPPPLRGPAVARRVLVVLCLVAAAAAGVRHWRRASTPRSLLLITIDTLRADRVGAYGSKRARTPNLDALAARGLLFENAVTAVPITLPSHATILTGLTPLRHGVHLNDQPFPAGPETLATRLKARGYATGAFVASYVLDRRFGLARGFDVYDDRVERGAGPAREKRRGGEVAAAAAAWIAEQKGPFAAWVHFYDPHFPYDPPAGFTDGDPYDGEVAYVDSCLGRLLALAEEHDAVVAVVADHGEDLGDHGERTHGLFLYDSTLRVPLILAGPGVPAGGRRTGLARTVDLLPTLLGLLRADAPAGLDGVDLLQGPAGAAAYAETEYPSTFGWSSLHALRRGGLKYVEAPRPELYDLAADRAEAHDVIGSRGGEASPLRDELAALRTRAVAPAAHAVSPEVAERLQAVGYVSGPGGEGTASRDPKDALGDYLLYQDAYTEDAAGRRDEAIEAYRQLAEREPGNVVFRRGLASTLNHAGRAREALAVLDDLVKRAPDDVMAWYERSKAQEAQSQLDEAIASAARATVLGPTSADAWNQLGVCQAKRGRVREALQSFAKGVEIDPTNGPIWLNRANAHRLLGEQAAAREAFQRASALMPRPGA